MLSPKHAARGKPLLHLPPPLYCSAPLKLNDGWGEVETGSKAEHAAWTDQPGLSIEIVKQSKLDQPGLINLNLLIEIVKQSILDQKSSMQPGLIKQFSKEQI